MKAAYTEVSWADMPEEDEKHGGLDRELDLNLPPILPLPIRTVDEDGNVTTIEWRLNEENKRVKITRVMKLVKKTTRVYHSAERRKRSMARFGECLGRVGPDDGVTYVDINDINVEMPKTEEEKEVDEQKDQEMKIKVACTNCGGRHFTVHCKEERRAPSAHNIGMGGDNSENPGDGKGGSSYVPPHLRGGAAGGGAQMGGMPSDELDYPVVRVDNLSENASKEDVKELFGPYGSVHRVRILHKYLKDRETGEETKLSRGIAFVAMKNVPDAERAIAALNRHGYDNLLLRVTMAETERERLSKKTATEGQNNFKRRY